MKKDANPYAKSIPFTKQALSQMELRLLAESGLEESVASGGQNTKECCELILRTTGADFSSLVPSCTSGLEAIFLALGIGAGDEVIMPSFTFPSTANAVALRGAVPVFVDIKRDTMNIDEKHIQRAINKKTKAIVVVHYAGVAANMDSIMEIANQYKLPIIDDAAQCFGAKYGDRHLGSIGLAGAFSFHYTKNISCGEGGAIVTSDVSFNDKLRVVLEKGTNRDAFLNNEVSKYQWIELGSSFLLSEISAAVLLGQLKTWQTLTAERINRWNYYYEAFRSINSSQLRLPKITPKATHNGHIFYFHVCDPSTRSKLISQLKLRGIQATTHFEPLHNSIAGKKYGRQVGSLITTEEESATLVRLPLWNKIDSLEQDRIISAVCEILDIV